MQFLNALNNDKVVAVAKLLYYGGNRTLEEILRINLDQVDFKKHQIKFDDYLIKYPEHVLCDIKALTAPRRNGRVFEGRQKAALNPRTVYRHFQEAAATIGLDPAFNVKWLTTKELMPE